jgi:methylthioribose-1-phosphate isomerase
MASGAVQIVLVGADRIARNGDTANKIGTYGLAVLAQYHRIPFYVAAPRSTFDLKIASGAEIPIELRSENEIPSALADAGAPLGAKCLNPAFDVTPAGLIAGIITESGLLEPVSEGGIRNIFD